MHAHVERLVEAAAHRAADVVLNAVRDQLRRQGEEVPSSRIATNDTLSDGAELVSRDELIA